MAGLRAHDADDASCVVGGQLVLVEVDVEALKRRAIPIFEPHTPDLRSDSLNLAHAAADTPPRRQPLDVAQNLLGVRPSLRAFFTAAAVTPAERVDRERSERAGHEHGDSDGDPLHLVIILLQGASLVPG